ncbi:hypothetical protein N7491_002824 [Penicillium cf. griseofulvum]|uniref:Uncharacterized protein n=1 Tax=Penicillium cf. griseofulvum TaxID=2972120 RepID=A0A9W9MS84_9EURO|nr:hypothetical protein N7472_003009 [Penicillium cf. griseofulvum]KAJ5440418.1 hypothetical protein N7491_002824 [Penicillium cf. griseofulvum]KAJ5448464.1 hypothetical protein N7445_003285 [Penicillium cf. griseofulvum]
MTLEKDFLVPVQDPEIDGAARLAELLRDAGISSALWGVNAAGCYGGGLCPLLTGSQDIEIVINEADQARTYELLCSYGCRPSQPLSDESALCLDDFEKWCELALHYKYYDRRRLRICAPIYELPKTGDSFNDSFYPFIIVYTAERMGLPAVPPLSKIEACTDSKNKISSHKEAASHQEAKRHRDYILISCLPHYILGSHESQSSLLAPEFSLLCS